MEKEPITAVGLEKLKNDGTINLNPMHINDPYLKLDEKLTPQISAIKAKNWLQSGTAYNDYIAVNVFRFSAID